MPDGVHSHEENYARTLDLMQRLAKVHPLFAEISWGPRQSGWKPWLKEPLITDVSLDEWIAKFKKEAARPVYKVIHGWALCFIYGTVSNQKMRCFK